jgi:hypothetical protein
MYDLYYPLVNDLSVAKEVAGRCCSSLALPLIPDHSVQVSTCAWSPVCLYFIYSIIILTIYFISGAVRYESYPKHIFLVIDDLSYQVKCTGTTRQKCAFIVLYD